MQIFCWSRIQESLHWWTNKMPYSLLNSFPLDFTIFIIGWRWLKTVQVVSSPWQPWIRSLSALMSPYSLSPATNCHMQLFTDRSHNIAPQKWYILSIKSCNRGWRLDKMIAEMSNIFVRLGSTRKIFRGLSPADNLVCISTVNKLSENATCPSPGHHCLGRVALMHSIHDCDWSERLNPTLFLVDSKSYLIPLTCHCHWFILNIKFWAVNNESSRQNQFLVTSYL